MDFIMQDLLEYECFINKNFKDFHFPNQELNECKIICKVEVSMWFYTINDALIVQSQMAKLLNKVIFFYLFLFQQGSSF